MPVQAEMYSRAIIPPRLMRMMRSAAVKQNWDFILLLPCSVLLCMASLVLYLLRLICTVRGGC